MLHQCNIWCTEGIGNKNVIIIVNRLHEFLHQSYLWHKYPKLDKFFELVGGTKGLSITVNITLLI